MPPAKYRSNIAAIIMRPDGKILLGERVNIPNAWQFPQGGVKRSESPLQALHRELEEELSLTPRYYRVIDSKGPYRYLFPPGRTKEGFDGQQQTYFLVQFTGNDCDLDVETETPEFANIRWIEPSEFQINWVPDFKQQVYRQIFADFFGVVFPQSG
jgi:putative (di)nucleoside polyphosphate hydrolase